MLSQRPNVKALKELESTSAVYDCQIQNLKAFALELSSGEKFEAFGNEYQRRKLLGISKKKKAYRVHNRKMGRR